MRLPFGRSGPRPMHPDLERVPDDLPRDGLFAQPLQPRLTTPDPETLDDASTRATFRLTVRDAEGRRCPDLAVQATITGPERTATGTGHTDLMGSVRFRMTGPPGVYRCTVDRLAGGALRLADDVDLTAEVDTR